MDKVSFQNGFICGMATKGLVRSGELYKPLIYNDSGVYTYFYLDFRRAMQEFSIGMFNESIVVHDSTQLSVTQITYVSSGVYKIWCDISGRAHGITVLNKKTSRLRFASGEQLPVFSVHMFIEGQDSYIDGGYIYESGTFDTGIHGDVVETIDDLDLWTAIDAGSISENTTFGFSFGTITETTSVTLT